MQRSDADFDQPCKTASAGRLRKRALAPLDIAAVQLALSRASGGALSVAELGPGSILARALFDLDRAVFLDGPVRGVDEAMPVRAQSA